MTLSSTTHPCMISRHFTSPDTHPYEQVEWETRTAQIVKADGTVVFEQEGIEVPAFWSETASNIIASKYFRGQQGTPEREWSVKQMIDRVVTTIVHWGLEDGYFDQPGSAIDFTRELTYILLYQYASFNSPVWFNIGVPNVPQQASACFLLDVQDTMESILDWYRDEAMIFKGGSGSGLSVSNIRSKHEGLSGGGKASGVLSFMKAADASAGVIQSGGRVRRAAKMVTLDMDHPEIVDFIWCKALEERKARALIAAGYDDAIDGEAYRTVAFQNANHSVNVPEAFLVNTEWMTRYRTSTRIDQFYKRDDLLREIAQACWESGDPGMQFIDTINTWHTCPNSGPIRSPNPCCFVGETLIDTSEGYLRFDELHEIYERGAQLPYVFSHNTQTNLPVLRQIKKVWVAGHTRSLVKVNTDKGITLLCTPEHKFLLRNGYYVEARRLEPGMRLRKIARWRNKERRNCAYINHRATDEHQSGTVQQARFIWEQVNGPINEGYDVHHINEDPTDDRISNLQLKPSKLHQQEHAKGSNNPRFIQVDWSLLVEVWEAIEAVPKGTHNTPGKPAVTPNRWNQYILKNNLSGVIPRAGSPTLGGRIQGMTWLEFEKSIADHKTDTNDTVLSIERVYQDQRVPVYDMEVEGTHNFAVTNGEEHSIIVHNSEYYFLPYTACNLASINLLKFLRDDNSFDVDSFCHTVNVLITAQEILVGRADYPTPAITQNSHDYRTLGLGYANLGALLMAKGLPYDSDEGRNYVATITALMTGQAYKRSAELATIKGPFNGFEANKTPMMDVILKHADALGNLEKTPLAAAACEAWNAAFVMGDEYGFRNAQVTLLAPTGTISLIMDCMTTGVEPDVALVNYKKLVGGGIIKKVNPFVPRALNTLGYSEWDIGNVLGLIESKDSIEHAIAPADLPVFDCAFPPHPGGRAISWQGHVKMVAALQPFLSGGISKTINMPQESTVEDIQDAFLMAWKLGCKSIAIYRDGCKQTQVLTTQQPSANGTHASDPITVQLTHIDAVKNLEWSRGFDVEKTIMAAKNTPRSPQRKRLPDERPAINHKGSVGGTELYLTVGLYDNGQPGELFIKMAKEGSTLAGFADALGCMISISLQFGVPLTTICAKLQHTRFEPSGFTTNKDLPLASSVVDYIARWLQKKFVDGPTSAMPSVVAQDKPGSTISANEWSSTYPHAEGSDSLLRHSQIGHALDAPICAECGSLTRKTGNCAVCETCGTSAGCN